jgi:hypothetical protein
MVDSLKALDPERSTSPRAKCRLEKQTATLSLFGRMQFVVVHDGDILVVEEPT